MITTIKQGQERHVFKVREQVDDFGDYLGCRRNHKAE